MASEVCVDHEYDCPKCGFNLYTIYEDVGNWGNTPDKPVYARATSKFYDHYSGLTGTNWHAIVSCPKCDGKLEIEDGDL